MKRTDADNLRTGAPGGFFFAVYRAVGDHIRVLRAGSALSFDVTGIAPYFADDPQISAYRDHVVIVHTYDTGLSRGLRCWTSEDAGETWGYDFLDSGGNGNVSQPNVTLRRGGGTVVAFQRVTVGDYLVSS